MPQPISVERRAADLKAKTFFDELWSQGDFWRLETSPYEAERFARQIQMVGGATYCRILEIGCGSGVFTRQLASLGHQVVGLDISEEAIGRARRRPSAPGVDYRVANVMDWDPTAEGGWDLVVMSETIYYVGWLYSFFDVAWLARRLFEATNPGGRLLLADTMGTNLEHLMRPCVIRTYHDLFVNVGFHVEREEIFRGLKDDVSLDCLTTLFRCPETLVPPT